MHEYSIAARVAEIVRAASREHNRRVLSATVAVGPLSMVVPELLYEAWASVTANSELAGAELRIEHVPVRAVCLDCGHETESYTPFVECASCGSLRLKLQSGHELDVLHADLEDAPEDASGDCAAADRHRQ
ncbi:MAG: hydrogenase maturation nickel metallochaperone HypA [candidate division WS1 bacterium]|nr:hydrogenase maturation nickel metallochaperone HypA [candidate division WS1 bacterium]